MLVLPCRHSPPFPSTPPSLRASTSACLLVDGRADQELLDRGEKPVDARACTLPRGLDGAQTKIARSFWDGLDQRGRAAVVAHETSHRLLGLDVPCELCCDAVGGFLLCSWGYTPEYARDAVASVVTTRPEAGAAAFAGACEGLRRGARARIDQRKAADDRARGLTASTADAKAGSDAEAAIARAKAAAKEAAALKARAEADRLRALEAAKDAAKQASQDARVAADAALAAAKAAAKEKAKEKSDAARELFSEITPGAIGKEVVVGVIVAIVMIAIVGMTS